MTATPLPDLEEIVEVSLQPASASALTEEPTPTRYPGHAGHVGHDGHAGHGGRGPGRHGGAGGSITPYS